MSLRSAFLKLALPIVLAVAPVTSGAFAAEAGVGVFVTNAPPAPRFERVPPPRYRHPERYAWVPGHWDWRHGHYSWVSGHYNRLPVGFARWEEGRWEHRDRGWVWIEGRWR